MGAGVGTRILGVHLYDLPLEAVYGDQPNPPLPEAMSKWASQTYKDMARYRPQGYQKALCAVCATVQGRSLVLGLSETAARLGARPGMLETEALARLPKLLVRARNTKLEARRLLSLAELLLRYGPDVEISPPGFLFVEIGKSQAALQASEEQIARSVVRLMERAGHRALTVVSKDPDTARSLLRHMTIERKWRSHRTLKKTPKGAQPGALVVPPGKEQRVLAKLSIGSLVWTAASDDEAQKRRLQQAQASLKALGIERAGQLLELPAEQLGSRLGEAGAILARRARAQTSRPLERFTPPNKLVESLELDAPVDDLEPVLFVLKRLFGRLEARLEARCLAACSLNILFKVEPKMSTPVDNDKVRPRSSMRTEKLHLNFARPSRRASTMLSLAKEQIALSGAVRSVQVEVGLPTTDHGAQLDLFNRHAQRAEAVGEVVGRLRVILGEDAVFSPKIEDTHRPESAWSAGDFSIEKALAEPEVTKPRRLQARKTATSGSLTRRARALPKVSRAISVIAPDQEEAKEEAPQKPWPKPIKRKPEDSKPEAPGPRPLEMLDPPEPARLQQDALIWRGKRSPLLGLSGLERLEAEWWTENPLTRDYAVAQLSDGRRLWVFSDPEGRLFVHGIFD